VRRPPEANEGEPHRQPFWARARICRSDLDAVNLLAHAAAEQCVPNAVALEFSQAVCTASASLVEPGGATVDLWEQIDGLVCRIARDTADLVRAPKVHRPAVHDPSANQHRPVVSVLMGDDTIVVKLTI
jgi:hypothetical protein